MCGVVELDGLYLSFSFRILPLMFEMPLPFFLFFLCCICPSYVAGFRCCHGEGYPVASFGGFIVPFDFTDARVCGEFDL